MKRTILYISFFIISFVGYSQSNTLYFMEDIPSRNRMNPAFIPNTSGYFDFILLPDISLEGGNNSFTLKNLMNIQNNTINLNQSTLDKLYKQIRKNTDIYTNFQLNILSFGFAIKEKNYLTFDLNLRGNIAATIPKDLFRLGIYGMPEEYGINSFNLNSLGVDVMLYSELGLGYMRKVGDKLTIGGKLKFLMGFASVASYNHNMTLNASTSSWNLTSKTNIYGSLPVNFGTNADGTIDYNNFELQPYEEMLRPSGYGGAMDIGFTYKILDNLTFSSAITDLGFINWKASTAGTFDGAYQFTGATFDQENGVDFEKLSEEFIQALNITYIDDVRYIQMLRANFYAGLEYGILDNKISFGLLSRLRFNNRIIGEEITVSTNFRPARWFKTSLSYSLINGRSNIGAGFNLMVGPFSTYLIMDYIPLYWASVNTNNTVISVPYNTSNINLQMGVNLNIGWYKNGKNKTEKNN